jgi:hypothetical protein
VSIARMQYACKYETDHERHQPLDAVIRKFETHSL